MNKKCFYLFGLLAIVMGMFVMSSCSNDDDDDSGIVGTWYGSREGEEDAYICTFKSDNTYTILADEYPGISELYKGIYSISGNVLTITLQEKIGLTKDSDGNWIEIEKSRWTFQRSTTYTYSISGKELTLSYTDKATGKMIYKIYTKK